MSAICLEHVSRSWGAIRAVDDVSFEAAAGKMLVLLGPSGCGKSTTLRLIAGLEAVSTGFIRIGGEDVTYLPPAARHLSMVFQSYALFPHLSVAENIIFGLQGLLERKPSQLSGGQQQRVALGRAIIAETPVCLMDEPLSNLDAQLRLDMRREIRGLQQKLGVTMVYVTHDQTEAMSMADQIILLREGRVEQDATPAELYARPATAFTARFIGTPPMNILALADAAGGAVIMGTTGPTILAGRGGGLLLGVRPEDVALSAPGSLAATVRGIEYLGADSILTCEVGGQALAVRVSGRVDEPAGAIVHLAWRKEHAHLFDAESGRRRDDIPVGGTAG